MTFSSERERHARPVSYHFYPSSHRRCSKTSRAGRRKKNSCVFTPLSILYFDHCVCSRWLLLLLVLPMLLFLPPRHKSSPQPVRVASGRLKKILRDVPLDDKMCVLRKMREFQKLLEHRASLLEYRLPFSFEYRNYINLLHTG